MENMNTMYNAPNQINVNQPVTNPTEQGDELYNPTDGQSYQVNTTNQDGSVNVTDPNTNQQQVIPTNDVENFIPQVKSNLDKKAWAEINVPNISFADLHRMGEGMVMLGVGGDIEDWVAGITQMLAEENIIPANDVEGTWKQYGVLTTSGGRTDLVMVPKDGVFDWGKGAMWRLLIGDCSWISDYIVNYEDQHVGGTSVSSLADQEINKILYGVNSSISKKYTNMQDIVDVVPINRRNYTFNNSSFQRKKRAKNMAHDWRSTRDMLMKMQKEDTNMKSSFASRQDMKLREIGKVADNRDPVSGLPINGEDDDDIAIGLTEYPYGEERHKGKGYEDYTMEEMDTKNLDDREHFRNELLLTLPKMRRKDLKEYIQGNPDTFDKFDKEERYASAVFADEIGFKTSLDKLRNELVQIRPITVATFSKAMQATTIEELDTAFDSSFTPTVENIYRKHISRSAAGEVKDTTVIEKPVQYKEISKAPGTNMGYDEPEAIYPAAGKAKEAITKLKTVQTTIAELQVQLKEATDPIVKLLNNAGKPFKEKLTQEQAMLKTYFDMVYDQLSKTSDKVGHYETDIFAAIERENVAAKPATLTEVLKKAEEMAPEIIDALKRVKSIVENERTTAVIEKYVYKYPIKGPQEKKIISSDELEMLLSDLSSAAIALEAVNATM